jgi:Terminase RNaseH-like domain
MAAKIAESEFVIEPIRIASGWRRVVAIDLDRSKLAAIWGAWDKANDVIYLYDEYVAPEAIALPVSADAIKKRGTWIPSRIDMESRGRSNIEGEALVNRFWALDVNVFAPPLDLAAGIDEARHRLAAGRLKVFSTCQSWLSEFRSYRLDEKGKIVDVNDHLVQATALLCQFGPETGISENIGSAIEEDENELDDSGATRNPVTGY